MKTKLLFYCILISIAAIAQTPITKTMVVQPGQKIKMEFDYPELIKVSTWDKNEISITGEATINGGENDGAFSLESTSDANEISVVGEIKNLKNLPHRITIWHNGKKIIFKTKEDYRKYTAENGRDYNTMNWGTDIDIFLVIKIPKNVETKILSTYGTIEIKEFSGPLTAESTYGGVDAALAEKQVGNLKAETNYGQIYTNFDFKFSGNEFGDFHTLVNAKPGSGPSYSFESKYGNVYLRKAL
ncbi:MAG: hypothetical protein JST48_05320 [Bacteroidetes bacterium]|nr:hypothetical protein [Bacteroidota bacterium]